MKVGIAAILIPKTNNYYTAVYQLLDVIAAFVFFYFHLVIKAVSLLFIQKTNSLQDLLVYRNETNNLTLAEVLTMFRFYLFM